MFKVSQEIRLNTNGHGGEAAVRNSSCSNGGGHHNNNNSGSSPSDSENVCVFGKYQRTPDADAYPNMDHSVFVAPELTDSRKVQLLHFPSGAVRMNSDVSFILKRNGVKGNFELKVEPRNIFGDLFNFCLQTQLESPAGVMQNIPLQILDPERFKVDFNLKQAGLYKVHIKCNSVPLPKSPYIIICISGEGETTAAKVELPVFKSDASKVVYRGLGLSHICLNEKNEFTVDGSEAGNNILFVGIFGPAGPCDEVVIKHTGRNIYKVNYRVRDPGDYILAAKWGDEHIPGSPFQLSVI